MVVVPLSSLYDPKNEDSKTKLLESFNIFECVRASNDVEKFLRKDCILFEDMDISRTYIIFDESDDDILGFFSLSAKALLIDTTSKTIKKKFTATVNPRHNITSSYLIGQIAKSKACGDRLTKYQLLFEAIEHIKEAKNIVGGRTAYLECNDSLVDYYQKAGFRFLQKNNDGLNQMFITL